VVKISAVATDVSPQAASATTIKAVFKSFIANEPPFTKSQKKES
jgi:hypothetical protein